MTTNCGALLRLLNIWEKPSTCTPMKLVHYVVVDCVPTPCAFGRYDQVRFGMLFGDASLGLEGSARRNAAIDTIQFGGTETGELKLGIMSEIHSFLRAARDIVRDFRSLSSSVGPSLEKLNAVPELRYMMDKDASGKVFEDLTLSARLYREDSEETAAGIQTVNAIISSVHLLLVALLYLIVFRRMVRVLMRQVGALRAVAASPMCAHIHNLDRLLVRKPCFWGFPRTWQPHPSSSNILSGCRSRAGVHFVFMLRQTLASVSVGRVRQ